MILDVRFNAVFRQGSYWPGCILAQLLIQKGLREIVDLAAWPRIRPFFDSKAKAAFRSFEAVTRQAPGKRT
jgi:alkylhydroperoxidase family enzyme